METPEAEKFRHINRKALKNKSLPVSFNEKDLRQQDYVLGFHKRKKRRRKEAQRQLEELQRRKRIEARKKRKLEREYVQNGGVLPATDAEGDEEGESLADDVETEPQPSVSVYDHGDMKATVMTSEISQEGENDVAVTGPLASKSSGADELHCVVTVSKNKPF